MAKSDNANDANERDQGDIANTNTWSASGPDSNNENGVLQYVRKILDQVKRFALWWA